MLLNSHVSSINCPQGSIRSLMHIFSMAMKLRPACLHLSRSTRGKMHKLIHTLLVYCMHHLQGLDVNAGCCAIPCPNLQQHVFLLLNDFSEKTGETDIPPFENQLLLQLGHNLLLKSIFCRILVHLIIKKSFSPFQEQIDESTGFK